MFEIRPPIAPRVTLSRMGGGIGALWRLLFKNLFIFNFRAGGATARRAVGAVTQNRKTKRHRSAYSSMAPELVAAVPAPRLSPPPPPPPLLRLAGAYARDHRPENDYLVLLSTVQISSLREKKPAKSEIAGSEKKN